MKERQEKQEKNTKRDEEMKAKLRVINTTQEPTFKKPTRKSFG